MNKILFASFVLTSLAAFGCSHITPVKGPDGQEWVAVSCSHGAKSCWKTAGEFCPLGYDTADEVQSTRGFLFFKHQTNEMLIHCKAPPTVAVMRVPAGAATEGKASPTRD